MKLVRILLVAALVCFPGCRKVPAVLPGATPPEVAGGPPEPTKEAAAAAPDRPGAPQIDHDAQVTVLGYHRFVDKVRHPDTEITPADFEAQLQSLKDGGISVITLQQFLGWRHNENSIPARSAIITVDDGYNSVYDVAWPILKKFGYPFTLFIYTDYVKGGPKSGGGSLTWAQLAEMRDAGVGIQSHTISHRDLRGGRRKAKGQEYEEWLWNELHGSREMLEQKLGIKVSALAVPYGYLNDHVKEMATAAGYEMLFTVNGMKLTCDTPMEGLGRWMVRSDEPKIFAAATAFQGGTNGASGATALDAQWFDPRPADGATITDDTPLIRAGLDQFGAIEPASVTLRLSGVGLLPAQFDAVSNTMSCQIAEPLKPGEYTVLISGRAEKGKIEGRWKFTVASPQTGGLATSPP